MDSQIDTSELVELVPVFRRLVPWQVVPEVAVALRVEDKKLGVAMAAERYHVADFSPW